MDSLVPSLAGSALCAIVRPCVRGFFPILLHFDDDFQPFTLTQMLHGMFFKARRQQTNWTTRQNKTIAQ